MPDYHNDLSMAELIAPICGGAGEDLGFSALFDQIKEARRADPAYLTQGDWQTDLKCADWEKVISLSALGLAERSKDLMLVAWLNEGLARRDHFAGMTFGLTLAERILKDFWDTAYPSLEDGIEERSARLSWLNTTLTTIAAELPITQGQSFGVRHYDESRHVENLALQNPKAMQTAVDEGKINAEIFQRSAVLTDTAHLQDKAGQISACLHVCQQLQTTVDRLYGAHATSFASLVDVLSRASQLTAKLLKDRGIQTLPATTETLEIPTSMPVASVAPVYSSAPLRAVPQNREEAFSMLSSVAVYFKQSEPQSPVPHLIERAIKWGNMPLEAWLSDVIKDSNVVDAIRDVLGTREQKP